MIFRYRDVGRMVRHLPTGDVWTVVGFDAVDGWMLPVVERAKDRRPVEDPTAWEAVATDARRA